MSSASGEFIKSLAAKGRIVITATRSGQETNATRFAGFFIAALNATDADTDQDGHTSVLESFVYANRLTEDFYKRAGRLASEHALIDDNGDGVGHDKLEAGEGLLARATYLDSLSVDEAAASATTAKLIKERARLEGEIEQLIARKANMQEAEYEATLERLFIRIGKGESFDQASGIMKHICRSNRTERGSARSISLYRRLRSMVDLALPRSVLLVLAIFILSPVSVNGNPRSRRTQKRRLRKRLQTPDCAARFKRERRRRATRAAARLHRNRPLSRSRSNRQKVSSKNPEHGGVRHELAETLADYRQVHRSDRRIRTCGYRLRKRRQATNSKATCAAPNYSN